MTSSSGRQDFSTDSFLEADGRRPDRPESRVLDGLLGDWRVTTEWKPIADGAVHRLRAMETRWIVDGRVQESRSFDDDGQEIAKVLCAFDPTVGDYVAFSVTVMSTCFVLERGRHDPVGRTLVLEGVEPVPGGRPRSGTRRTVQFGGVTRTPWPSATPTHRRAPTARWSPGTSGSPEVTEPITLFRPTVAEDAIVAAGEVLRSGWPGPGPMVERVKREFADFVGAPHAVAVSSGTAALHPGGPPARHRTR